MVLSWLVFDGTGVGSGDWFAVDAPESAVVRVAI